MHGSAFLSGHQPSFFHAGILAKRVALEKRARASDAKCLWLLSDQDVNDPGSIAYPDLDEDGNLVRRTWHALPSSAGVPTFAAPWKEPSSPPRVSSLLPTSIQAGLDRMHDALVQANGDTIADRFHEATELLLEDLLHETCSLVKASTILDMHCGRTALEKIASEPKACAHAWNEAVGAVERSARRLKVDGLDDADIEAPVWVLDARSKRQRGTIRDVRAHLEGGPRVSPRAFFMTAIARAELCTQMIHGTGGERYEVVTQLWAESFLGFRLAPTSIVTATLRLPLDEFAPEATPTTDIDLIRRLEHDPWPDRDEKRRWLEKIEAAPPGSVLRQEIFQDMHSTMGKLRVPLAATLSGMRASRVAARTASASAEIASERTWPWPLHDAKSLESLTAKVE